MPAARVMSMIELSTVAGASSLEPSPWPRASKPTASTAESTSGAQLAAAERYGESS